MIKYLLFALIAFIGFIFTYITCPIWAFIAAAFKLEHLPWPLSWVTTHDDTIYGSGVTGNPNMPDTFIDRFKTACWWIWRNPNYGFNSEILGVNDEGAQVVFYRDDQTFDTGQTSVRSYDIIKNGKKYFGYRRDQHLWGKRFIKMWFGWQADLLGDSKQHMLKTMFNPFRSIE